MNIAESFGVASPTVFKYKDKVECVNPDLIIGFELETENCVKLSGEGWTKLARPYNITLKTDNSLRGVAYEFITRPMRSTESLAAVRDFLTSAEFNEVNYSDRCSIHVHVNCLNLEPNQVASVSLLYSILEDVLFEFVGQERDNNIFCIPWNQCQSHLSLIYKFLTNPSNTLREWNKYTAVNLIPLAILGTIEFRQMHGTANFEKIKTWVNIIGAIFNYGTRVELKDLITEIKELNSTSNYEAFFNKVLAGQLPYNENYRIKLEAGVILAKIGLIGFENPASKKEKSNPAAGLVAAAGARVVRGNTTAVRDPFIIQYGDLINAVRVRADVAENVAPWPGLGEIAVDVEADMPNLGGR